MLTGAREGMKKEAVITWLVLPLGLLGFLLLVRGHCVCLTMLLFHRFWKVGNPSWKWCAVPPLAQCDYTDPD